MKTNETKTTKKTNATKTNKTATDILTIAQLKTMFIENGIIPKFSDSTHYVGCGIRSNMFSVNILEKKYNIYCNDTITDALTDDIDGVTVIIDGNKTDKKTRPNLISVNTTDALKTVIDLIKPILPSACIINQ